MEVRHLLREAEVDAEKISAVVRLVVLVTLAAVLYTTDRAQGAHPPVGPAIGVYGVGTVIGLVLAWRRIFHPVIPYLFVTFDVILVSLQILLLTGLMGMDSRFAFALPGAGLIFVILIYASMRYRPWLILYAAALFLAAINLGNMFFTPAHAQAFEMHRMRRGAVGTMMNYQVLPFTLVTLSAFILFVMSRRTRALLMKSIALANRTARLSRYFSPNLATSLADGDDDHMLKGRRQPVAVLFVDIRGFTSLGESMAPDELGAFLSEYRNRLTRPIFAHDGTVDKFIGDAIMAVFGTPFQGVDDARRALQCALDIIDTTARWSEERARSANSPVAIGIGAHYGEVFAGAMGNEQLLEYTVIGDTVNVAERLERLSRDVESPLVVSAALLEAAKGAMEMAEWHRLPSQALRGHRHPVDVYSLDLRTNLSARQSQPGV